MKRRLRNLTVLLLSVLLLSGCWQADDPDAGGLTELLPEDEAEAAGEVSLLPEQFSLPYMSGQTLDPVTCPDGMQQVVSSLVCEGLFRQGPDFEPEPWLCASYTADEAYLVYTFTLRPGVTFSDGTPLSGSHVKATLTRARTSTRYQARLADVVSISADENTVTITLSAPNSALPALLDIPIVKTGSEQDTLPIGTGPYFLSQENGSASLVANQTWWQGGGHPVERISLVEAADQETVLYRFSSRDVQLITADLTGTATISVTGNIRYQDTATTSLQYLGCNVSRAPLNSAPFRRALSLGINRPYIVSAFLSGHGNAAQFPLSPVSPLYPHTLETSYSHDAYMAALTASNYTPERTLSLLVNAENSFKVSAAQYLAESFTSSGVPMEVRALPWEEYTAALASGDFDLYYGEVRLTADWDLSALLGTGGALNYTSWSNVPTDHLLSSYAGAADRAAAMETLCAHLQVQAPILPLCFKSTSILLQSEVIEGLTPTVTEPFYNLSGCTIHLREAEAGAETE